MEETPNDLFDLLEDRALGGAGTSNAEDCNPPVDDANGCNRGASLIEYWEGRRLANRIAEQRRLKRKAGASLKAGEDAETGASSCRGREATADLNGEAHLSAHRLAGLGAFIALVKKPEYRGAKQCALKGGPWRHFKANGEGGKKRIHDYVESPSHHAAPSLMRMRI